MTTSVLLDDAEQVTDITCNGCPCFADSILYLDQMQRDTDSSSNCYGWCVHTACASIIAKHRVNYDKASTSPTIPNQQFSDAFEAYVAQQSILSCAVTLLHKSASYARYLVVVDAEESFRARVSVFSTCIVRHLAGHKYVHCRDIRCCKGKRKRVLNITSPSDVCCHLQSLLSFLNFDCGTKLTTGDDEEPNIDGGTFVFIHAKKYFLYRFHSIYACCDSPS